MVDNVPISAGTGTNVASDDIGGVQYQRVKLSVGADGTAVDASAAAPVPVYDPDVVATGTITATDAVVGVHAGAGVLLTGTPTAASYVALAMTGGKSGLVVQLTGAFGAGTYWFEGSINSTTGIDGNWTTLSLRQQGTTGTASSTVADSVTAAGLWRGSATGMTYVRVRTTGATAPSVAVVIRATGGEGPTGLTSSIPTGTNIIGTSRVQGVAVTAVSGSIAAAGTGTIGPVDISTAGNVTFTARNTVAANAWAGAPVLVFEQSDDNTSWGPLKVVRCDTNEAASTFVLGVNAASTSIMFDAPAEAISWVRCRVTTGPTTNAMTISISAGGMAFSPMLTTVDRKDAARVAVMVTFTSTAAAAADTLLTLALNKGATASSVTTVPVTANKILRITGITVSLRTTTAALPFGKATLRVNYTGAAVLASVAQALIPVSGAAAVIGNAGFSLFSPDDGIMDLSGVMQFGLSFSNNVATNVTDITITGYEFAA